MSTFKHGSRSRRAAQRRSAAIQAALATSVSRSMREELLAMANRDF